MTGTCNCGAVTITLKHKPDFVNDCNCSFCAPMNAWWGYFNPADVQVTGNTATVQRSDRALPAVDAHSCLACGATTHWVLRPHLGNETMGVNMRLFSHAQLHGIERRFPDGANWDGTSPYGYRKPAEQFDGISH